MRAVVQTELGGPEVLHLATVDRPVPSIGQVLIEVHAAGVNPADQMNRQQGTFARGSSFTLGWDVSGVVAQVGPGVTLFQPGDEVFGLLPFPHGAGAYAEYVLAPARALVRKPEQIDHISAAALPLAALTAWQALVETAGVHEGSRVLITGAAGGVGHLAVQIAKARGAHVIALASADSAEALVALGADEVVDYRSADFTEVVSDVDVVLEVLGGDYPQRAVSVLREGGTLVSTLPQSLPPAIEAATAKGVRLAGLFVESDRLGLGEIAALASDGRLTPTIAATYPLAEAAQAHATKHGSGKVVLVAR